MAIFPLAPDQTIAQMWSNGVRGGVRSHASLSVGRIMTFSCGNVIVRQRWTSSGLWTKSCFFFKIPKNVRYDHNYAPSVLLASHLL